LAFNLLKSHKDFEINTNDKIEIKGDEVFAMYSENNPGRTLLLESHLKFIDIHFVIEGNDRFAYAPLGYDGIIEQSRNIENDLITYSGDYPMDFNLNKDFFVVLFPQDIHSPCLEPVRNKKIVVKVAIG
jgi:biofilm protein TabA